jgi:hypothetical protein
MEWQSSAGGRADLSPVPNPMKENMDGTNTASMCGL